MGKKICGIESSGNGYARLVIGTKLRKEDANIVVSGIVGVEGKSLKIKPGGLKLDRRGM